jgi:enoyl-CoA hydratase/carnithine racemase
MHELVLVEDRDGVRTLTLNRPDALNAFNEALYDATARALNDAAADPAVSVLVLTGTGRAFSAGTDLHEMTARVTDADFTPGEYGFVGLVDALVAFGKPLVVAVNGIGLGIGVTVLGFADLAFMSSTARLKCPFTSLGVAPEAASSYLLPELVGRQNAAWILLSSEWIDAAAAREMGLVWRVCEPEELLTVATDHARRIAAHPLPSLLAVKQTMVDRHRQQVRDARDAEHAAFARLLGDAANLAALEQFSR